MFQKQPSKAVLRNRYSSVFDFTMHSIFWNNLFTGKNLLKQAKYLASPNKNLTSSSINNEKTR